jgi:threonine/homoserine/homoserine lactone efflux protein
MRSTEVVFIVYWLGASFSLWLGVQSTCTSHVKEEEEEEEEEEDGRQKSACQRATQWIFAVVTTIACWRAGSQLVVPTALR